MSLLNSVKDVLSAGLNDQDGKNYGEIPTSPLTPILNRSGARVDDAVRAISDVMNMADSDKDKLNAAKEVLTLHGVRSDDNRQDNRIQIMFVEKGDADPEALVNMLNPQRIIEAGAN